MEKYYEGELVTFLAYKRSLKGHIWMYISWLKEQDLEKRTLSPNPSHLCPND